LNLSLQSIYLLAAPSTPQAAKEEVIERAANGEKLWHNTIKEIVGRSRPPKPASNPGPKPEVQPEPTLQVTDGTMGNDTDPAQSAAAFAAIHAAEFERVTITPPALSAITEKLNLLQAWDQASEEDRKSFLDALGVNVMLKSMSAQFKAALHTRLAGDPTTPPAEPAAGQVQVEPATPARPIDHTDYDDIPTFLKRDRHDVVKDGHK
jgi:hypothetical protein